MPVCHVTQGYQLEFGNPLRRGWGVKMAIFSVAYLLNDPNKNIIFRNIRVYIL